MQVNQLTDLVKYMRHLEIGEAWKYLVIIIDRMCLIYSQILMADDN